MFRTIICTVLLLAFPLLAHATVAQLPRTGQTKCYDSAGALVSCTGTGQDGDKLAGVAWPMPRFTDNGNGTVTDDLTGLIWLKNADCFAPQSWPAALASATSLHDGQCGLTDNSDTGDWRLPNVVELESLFDLSQINKALPAPNPFNAYGGWYWTSSTHAALNGNAWCSNVAIGNIQGAVKATNLYRLWPVAGQKDAAIKLPKSGQATCWDGTGNVTACAGTGEDGDKQSGVAWPSPRFTDNGNGTITDNLTGLVWMKKANCWGIQSWQQALDASNALASGACGLTDGSTAGQWRLPNRKELLRLTNYELPDNRIWLVSQGFGNDWGDWYWTSDSVTGTPGEKWLVHTKEGGARPQSKIPAANGYYTISVRDPVTPKVYFAVSAPASAIAGSPFTFTVTALTGSNQTAAGYTGTVHFTSTDSAATLPANATLKNGVGTFPATFNTEGDQTITATDSVTASISGTSNIVATSSAPTHFAVSAPASAMGGASFSFTVTAVDGSDHTATGYTGLVHFTSSDSAAALPAISTLTNGVGTFPATFYTAGNQTITATDTVTTSLSGTSNIVAISSTATHFAVSAPTSATAGASFTFTVTALDGGNHTATGYSGMVHFTSSDSAATLPAISTLTNGVATFPATFNTAGNQTITATDTATAPISGTSNAVATSAATHATIAVAPLPRTGETKCYDSAGAVISCTGTGQDGDKLAGVAWPTPRFADNGNGTVTDNLTGLVWLKNGDCFAPQSWSAALATANSLHDGQCGLADGSVIGDWRLPNVVELESLFDLSQINKALPAPNPFNAYGGWYWTSSSHAALNANAWCSNVAIGNIQAAVKASNLYRLWPVAGQKDAAIKLPKTGQATCWDGTGNVIACAGTGEDGEKQIGAAWPSPRFVDNGNGTITDNLTGLIWMKNANCSGIKTWQQALDASNALASGACGLTDGSTAGQWRLPNRKELLRLTNYQEPDNAIWLISQGFGSDWGDWYWTSDTVTGTTSEKWLIHVQVGGARPQSKVPAAPGYYSISVRDPVTP